MSEPRLELEAIEFRPENASRKSLRTRLDEDTAPCNRWTKIDGDLGAAYPLSQWSDGHDRLELEVTLSIEADCTGDLWIAAAPTPNSSRVLGGLQPMAVARGASTSTMTLAVTMTDVVLGAQRIGRHLVEWEWRSGTSATDITTVFGVSTHRIYTTLAEPVGPWSQAPGGGSDYPWIAALDHACRWAAGECSEKGVRERITKAIDALGGIAVNINGRSTRFSYSAFSYFCRSVLSMSVFEMTKFLSVLNGTTNIADPLANCADLAAAVGLFATVLGCAMRIAQLRGQAGTNFSLNTVRVFGLDETRSAVYTKDGFDFHRTGALENAGDNESIAIFDACLQLDFRGAPGKPPFCWSPTTGTPLWAPHQVHYLERLVDPVVRSTVTATTMATPAIRFAPGLAPPGDWILARFKTYREQILASLPADFSARALPPDVRLALVPVDERPWISDTQGRLPARRFLYDVPGQGDVLVVLQQVLCPSVEAAVDVAAERLASAPVQFGTLPGVAKSFVMIDGARAHAVVIADRTVVFAASTGVTLVDVARLAMTALNL